MSRHISLRLFGLSCLLLSCEKNGDDFERLISKLNQVNNQFTPSWEWVLHEKSEATEPFTTYTCYSILNDTTKSASFNYYKEKDSLEIGYLEKRFLKDGLSHVVRFKTDTLFYYTIDESNPENKMFIVGRYQFLYMYLEMSEEEMNFFELHQDSLRRIRGNDLPALPTILHKNIEKEQEFVPSQ